MLTPAQVLQRNRAIEDCLIEADRITKNPKASRRDMTRAQVLMARVSALKSGYTPEQLAQRELNQLELEQGLDLTAPRRTASLTPERAAEMRAWMNFHRTGKIEQRIGEEGDLVAQFGTFTGLGTFVPHQFLERVSVALKQFDPLFDPDVVQYVETEKAGPLHIPVASDIANDASPAVESTDNTDEDFTVVATSTEPKAFKTPYWKISIEAQQDIESWLPIADAAEYFFSQRLARGVGRDLVSGSGNSGHINGLLNQLVGSGAVPVTAVGSAINTGGSETGANSIGTTDLAKLYTSVNAAYRKSPKAAWLMNDNTFLYLLQLTDKVGRPIVSIAQGLPYIFGKPVYISPSLDDIGASKTPVLFGDFGRFLLHCAKDAMYAKRYDEAPGLVEKGVIGYRLFARYDGALLDAGNHPINSLQNHS